MSCGGFSCEVLSASEDGAFAAVQIRQGRFRIGAVLLCAETGRRYRLVSVGMGPPSNGGREVFLLEAADELPLPRSLATGMHLAVA